MRFKVDGRTIRSDEQGFLLDLDPSDPVRAICKLAGLPMPQPDTRGAYCGTREARAMSETESTMEECILRAVKRTGEEDG